MCKHENHMLMGVADGIVCRGCGKVFASFDELDKERNPEPPKKGKKKKEAAE